VLVGGTGDDQLFGEGGFDRYVFEPGHGGDTLYETGTDVDEMSFSDVSSDQLWFQRSGQDLLVSTIGTGDKVTVKGWYSSTQSQVELIEAADGKVLVSSQVDALVSAMAGLQPPSSGQTTLPPSYQTQLAPVLAAWSGN
jgi:Ca2+-binding RTX toxin-like protein